jgi:hypothetical protein
MLPCSRKLEVREIKFSHNSEPMRAGILPIMMGTTPGQYGKKMGTRGGEAMLQCCNSTMRKYWKLIILK